MDVCVQILIETREGKSAVFTKDISMPFVPTSGTLLMLQAREGYPGNCVYTPIPVTVDNVIWSEPNGFEEKPAGIVLLTSPGLIDKELVLKILSGANNWRKTL